MTHVYDNSMYCPEFKKKKKETSLSLMFPLQKKVVT